MFLVSGLFSEISLTGDKNDIQTHPDIECRGKCSFGYASLEGSDLIKLQRNMTRIRAPRDDSECTHKQKHIVNNITVGITCYRKG